MTSGAHPVVIAANESYLLPLAALIVSAGCFSPGTNAHVLADGILPSSKRALMLIAHSADVVLSFHDVDPLLAEFEGLLSIGHTGRTTWSRLFIEPLLEGESRALYLDADTILLGSLSELLGADLQGKTLGAVRDFLLPVIGSPGSLPGLKASRSVRVLPYFNAGVLLIDLEQWRSRRVAERARALALRHPERLEFQDQDALNLILVDDWLELPSRWNFQHVGPALRCLRWPYFARSFRPFAAISDGRCEATVWHFLSPIKPWTHPEEFDQKVASYYVEIAATLSAAIAAKSQVKEYVTHAKSLLSLL